MRKHKALLLFLSLSFVFAEGLLAAVNDAVTTTKMAPTEQQKLMEELTGKKALVAPKPAVQLNPAQPEVSRHLLDAGFFAFTKKDYISALKHYNTIIVKYPKSKELHLAYLAKSKLYSQMGLTDQARLNLQIANQIGQRNQLAK